MKRTLLWCLGLGVLILVVGIAVRVRRVPIVLEARPTERGKAFEQTADQGTKETTPHVKPQGATLALLDAPTLLNRFLARHREADRSNNDSSHARFSREQGLSLTEGRLLVLSSPEQMITLLDAIAADTSRDSQDRFFAIHLLGYLADVGNKGAEASLVRLAFSRERDISGTAVKNLAESDQQGLHRQIYERSCEAGIVEAFDAIAHWADAGSIALMNRLSATDGPKSALSDMAKHTMRCYDLLLAPDWIQQIASIIANPSHEKSEMSLWAIKVARVRAMPGIETALRARLDATLEKAQQEHKELERITLKKFGNGAGRQFEARYATEPMSESLFDNAHDDALLAFTKCGGKLTDSERKRLRTFGYSCDPKQRLAELMNTEK